jgi:hypothetical protein
MTPYLDEEVAKNNNIPAEFVSHWNSISHWINESFIIAMCSVLECHKFYDDKNTKINQFSIPNDVIEKWKLLRDIRNYLCHNKSDMNDRNIKQRMITYLILPKAAFKHRLPLSITDVIKPLYDAVLDTIEICCMDS